MADEFSDKKNVSDVRGAVNLPTYNRGVTAKTESTPDFQSSVNAYAQSANSLSAIGTTAAQSASNQMAATLGYESGKKPHGDLTPSFTEFDKHFEESYHAQANATLQIQGQSLLDDAQVQMSKSTRLTPQLIAQTNNQVQTGLAKISANAPTAIKGQLEATFASQALRQSTQYKEKMISDDREDTKNKLINASDIYVKNAQELAISGDMKGSKASVASAIQAANTLEASHAITAEEARNRRETAVQAGINGELTYGAVKAYKEGKYPEFAAQYAKNGPPSGMTHEQYLTAGQHFEEQVNFLHGLSVQDENLKSAEFRTKVTEDITGAGASLINHQSEVSAIKFQEDKLFYLNALKRQKSLTAESYAVIAGWGNREVFERSTEKGINAGFDTQVKRKMITSQNNGQPTTLSIAEAQVAASAAGPVPTMIKLLNAKLNSVNPQDIEDAGKSIYYMHELKKSGNLTGVTDQSIAMMNKYEALRQTGTPANEAAIQAYDKIYGAKTGQKQIDDENWNELKKTVINPAGSLNYYTQITGIDRLTLVDPEGFTEQAEALLSTNMSTTHGDINIAKKMTSDAINSSYGETHVNGKKQTVFFPLEDAVGIHDGAPFIQEDIIEQVNKQIAPIKEAFDKGTSQYYWEFEPRLSSENKLSFTEQNRRKPPVALYGTLESTGGALEAKHGIPAANPGLNKLNNPLLVSNINAKNAVPATNNVFERDSEMTIRRHWKDGHTESYPLTVKANPWLVKLSNTGKPYGGSWDIVLGTGTGWKPLQQLDPMQGDIISYEPNIERIKAKYAKFHAGNQ